MGFFSGVQHTDFISTAGCDQVTVENDYYKLEYCSHSLEERQYSPMDYYYSPVPENKVHQILGTSAPLKLYLLYSALNSSDDSQICNWIKYFGHSSSVDSIEAHGDKSVHLVKKCYIKWDIDYFKFVIFLIKTMQSQDVNMLINLLHDIIDSPPKKPDGEPEMFFTYRFGYDIDAQKMKELVCENPYPVATDILSSLFVPYIGESTLGIRIGPDYKKEKKSKYATPLLSWEYPNLRTALYLMLALDISQNGNLTNCQNPLCGIIFNASREDVKYCSAECKNRAKQQRHRKKIQRQKTGE